MKGFHQREGIDYHETFSPVVRKESVQIILAVAAHLNLQLLQMDVKTAFLYGELDEELFVEKPEGFVIPGKEKFVYKLNNSLYGLKQAPRMWNKKITSVFTSFGLHQLRTDPSVFVSSNSNYFLIVALYVDDLLIASSHGNQLEQLKVILESQFEMKNLGEPTYLLGVQITKTSSGIKISQEKYISELLSKFDMTDCKPVPTPVTPGKFGELGYDLPSNPTGTQSNPYN